MTKDDIITSSGKYPDRSNNPECTPQVVGEAEKLALRVTDLFRELKVRPCITSGFRTRVANALSGGAHNSAHLFGQAVDIADPEGSISSLLLDGHLLTVYDLYMEDPAHTPGWAHLTTRAPPSLKRVFIP